MSGPLDLRQLADRTRERLVPWGIDPLRGSARLRGAPLVRAEHREFERQRLASDHPTEFPPGPAYRVYEDRYTESGVATGHYFHQDLLVAREVHARRPRRHVDVGSSVYGFVSHVAAFREIEVLDVRPLAVDVPGIRFVQQDVMALGEEWRDSTDSLSCLHALEHFGLGRYGDPVDYDGWRAGLRGLTSMVVSGGTFYLSVPTGERQRVEFNAHRVFSLPFLHEQLTPDFEVERLAFVTDDGALVDDVDPEGAPARRSFGAQYGCSIWVLRKR